jgi:hypothetical protein
VSFLGKLFGSDKALEKVVDTGKELLDEAFYTEQEEAADRSAARDKAQGMVIEWIEASTGSRLARRAIALGITGTWLFMYILSTLMAFLAVWIDGSAEQLIASASLIDDKADTIVSAVMVILGFYFAAPFMGDMAKGALERFGRQ